MVFFLVACGSEGGGVFRGQVQFKPPVIYPTGSMPQSIIQGDFDGDQFQDIAVANEMDDSVTLFFGNGTGVFPPSSSIVIDLIPIEVEFRPVAITRGHFNIDDIDDIAVVSLKSSSISIILGNTNRSSIAPRDGTIGVGVSPRAIAVGDFDGILAGDDLAVVNSGDSQTDGSVSILLGTVNSFGLKPTNKSVNYKKLIAIVSGYFNSDSLADLVVLDQEAEVVFVLLGFDNASEADSIVESQGDFLLPVAFPVGAGPSDISSGDFNGDGKLDVVVVNSQDLTLSILLGKGDDEIFEFAQTIELEGVLPFSIDSGDINGDGNLDIAIVDMLNNTVSVLLGIGNGEFALQKFFSTELDPISVVLSDVNGDLKLDMAVANSGNDTISVFLNAL